MSHGTKTTVECPLCGTTFDPSEAGGWCTNSDCGDWQYEGGDAVRIDDSETGEETATERADADGEAEADERADAADSTGEADAESAGGGDLSCPACETSVAAADNFCRACGTNLSHVEPGTAELSACPECETDVESEDRFCRNCGEDLDVYRPGTGEPATQTDGPASRQANGGSPASDAAGPAGADQGGEVGEAPPEGEAAPADGPRLSLVVRNREIQVGDGDTVGRKIRSVIMDTGGDEADAVRVHREHVRFEREDDQFHLVDLGRNPTIVNGERLDEGDRVPVSPGDRLELSGIATIEVREA